jgi:hypothetical protein
MKSDSLPNLPSLTPDDRVWRLDWFGECAYPGSIRRYAQPSIKVVLSPLRSDLSDHSSMILPDSTDHQHQHETWAPIAALPMLAIGDLWQHGRQIASPDYQVETFKGLGINSETASFVKAGLAIEEHFLLPLSCHPWHRLHTQSYCVAVALDEGRRLLVPCVEIIRFYFGSSSNFLQRLFTAPLTQDNLWSSKRFNPANRHLHLVLANRLSGLSATDIGRIAESKFAWRAAAGIHASCQKASAHGHPAYPYTGFPFEGATDLAASGTWLPFGEQEYATFLAYRLRSCSHPFPFRSLSYEAGDRKALHASSGDAKGGPGRFSRSYSQTQKTEAADIDPCVNKAQRRATFVTQRRFTDLLHKQVWREKIEAMPNADVFLRQADGSLAQVALGESTWSSTTSGVDVLQSDAGAQVQKDVLLPWFVQVGLKAIETAPAYESSGRRVQLVCPVGKLVPVFSLPVVISEDGVIASELLFTSLDGSTRQRRGCFVEAIGKDSYRQCMLILEGSMKSVRPEIVAVDSAELKRAIEIATLSKP